MLIEPLTLPPSAKDLEDLSALLVDAVASGAAVSFLHPLSLETARRWWTETLGRALPRAIVLVAREDERVVGTVQMHPSWAPNQPHRGEVAKLLVKSSYRSKGLGAELMRRIASDARTAGLRLLTLDAKAGGPAERLYRRLGWVAVGAIPGFALDPDGVATHATVIFYRDLV